MGTKKKKPGRPAKGKNKVKVVSAYLTEADKSRVNKKYGNLTEAIKVEVLPKCG